MMPRDDDDDSDHKAVRVAAALSRAVELSDELQTTVLELASALRSSCVMTELDPPSSGDTRE